MSKHDCLEPHCGRSFMYHSTLVEHAGMVHGLDQAGRKAMADAADAQHTFDDIRRMLSEVVREEYNKPGTAKTSGTWAWVEDIADDWVVYSVEAPKDCKLFKAGYSIVDNKATLGESVEVVRRTVYDAVAG